MKTVVGIVLLLVTGLGGVGCTQCNDTETDSAEGKEGEVGIVAEPKPSAIEEKFKEFHHFGNAPCSRAAM